MERSAIRGWLIRIMIPDYASLHPGYGLNHTADSCTVKARSKPVWSMFLCNCGYSALNILRHRTPSANRPGSVRSGRRDMRAMPQEVRRSFGVALYAVQIGVTPPIAKVLKGFGGAGVLELIEDDAGGTYQAVYTVSYASAVYVLHVFQKKSKRGKQTSQRDVDLIRDRLKRAGEIHKLNVTESKP
jgi:phage-related protein